MSDGIEAGPVTEWMVERAEVTPPLEFSMITAGRSNVPYTGP